MAEKLPKRPTGQLPKRNSSLAKYIMKEYKLDQKTAQSAAGAYENITKKNPNIASDTSTYAIKKAIKRVTTEPIKKKVNKDLPNAKTVKAVKKAVSKMSSTKANTPGSTITGHQKDLAKMSGNTAATKKFNELKKSGKQFATMDKKGPSPSYVAGKKTEKATLKSFKSK